MINITDNERYMAAEIQRLNNELTAHEVTVENLKVERDELRGELALWANPDRSVIREMAALVSERDAAVLLLDNLFDKFENGVPCYEDPEELSGFIGNAVNFDHEEFRDCCEILNRLAPRAKEANHD